MSRIFVSYARRDLALVDSIVENMEAAGIGVWIDREDIKPGKTWRVQIVEAIATCDAFVLMLSSNSAASDNVRKEIDLAQDTGCPIFIMRLDPVKLPAEMLYQLVGLQHIDLPQLGVDKAIHQLIDTLDEHLAIWKPPDNRNVRRVELVFQDGAGADFGAREREETLGLIAVLTETPQSELDIATLEVGGVHVFVDMPATAAFTLKARALNGDRQLDQFGVKSLRLVGDRQYINIAIGSLKPPVTPWTKIQSLFSSLFESAAGKVIITTTVVVVTTVVGLALADGLKQYSGPLQTAAFVPNPTELNPPSLPSDGGLTGLISIPATSSEPTSTSGPIILPTSTPLPTRTIAPSPSPTATLAVIFPTPVSSPTPTWTKTVTVLAVPATLTGTPTPTATYTPTSTNTLTPTSTPTPTDTTTPTPTATPTDTPTPSPTSPPMPNVFGVDVLSDNLWLVNKTSGAGQLVGQIGFDEILGLSCSQNPGKLYAADSPLNGNSTLLEVDIQTGLATVIGDIGFDSVTGLAFDSRNGILYAITYLDEFLTIDTNTGQGTLVSHPGSTFLDSLAYDPQQQALFAVNINTGDLYRIDLPGGMGQVVGATGFSNISGLAYDATTDTLYGAARASGELVTLDINTGAGSRVGSMPNTAFNALAACPGN